MTWRFYPLEGFPQQGIVTSSSRKKPSLAEFLTPAAAKTLAQRKAAQ